MSRCKRPCILVTGVGGRSVGHQILYALQLTGDKYRIVTVDANPFSFGLYNADASYLVPLSKDPDYISAILEIMERESVDVLIPGTEPEVLLISYHKQGIQDRGFHVIANPEDVVKLCSNKWVLHVWLQKHGFKTPRTRQAKDWRKLVEEEEFPLVGKPCTQSGGSRNVSLLKDIKEVEQYLKEAEDDVILQEYMGAGDNEFTVGVVIDKEGAMIDSIVLHRKLIGLSLGEASTICGINYALSTGYSQGFIVRHEMIQKRCEELAMAIGARGPLNIQCRLVDGEIKIFEVHPRFSGTTSIRAEVGFNVADILIQNMLFGTRFGRQDYQLDVAAIRALQHIIVPIKKMESISRVCSHG